MKIKVNTQLTTEVEIEVPEFFSYEGKFCKFSESKSTWVTDTVISECSSKVLIATLVINKITPITERQFKEAICRTFARLAGIGVTSLEVKPLDNRNKVAVLN